MGDENQTQSAQKNNLLLIIATVFITLGLLGLGAFGFWFVQKNMMKIPQPSPSAPPSPSVLSSPSVFNPEITPLPTPTPTPSPQLKTDLELIKEAFAKKYNKPLNEVNVSISEHQDPYAKGGVGFTGEMGGAMWLAYKQDGDWVIVWDGNGTIPCDKIEPYNFPVSMVPECWDESTGTLVIR